MTTPLANAAHIEKTLRTAVAERLKIDAADVPMDVSIIGELGLESIEVMQLLLQVEEEFPHFRLTDSADTDPRTLRELVEQIDRASRPPSPAPPPYV